MKTICVLALGALVVGCHLDKLIGGSGGPHPTSTAPPVALVFMAQPGNTQVGQKITPAVQVSVVDSVGVPVAGVDTATVSVTLGVNPGGATLLGDTTAKPTRGVATFGNISLDKPGQGYTLIAHVSVTGPPDKPSVSFNITPPPPTTGSITITTSTTGLDLDLDGYTVTVDGGANQPIATNSSGVTFTGLAAGNHSVVLSGVASNCSVTGGSSRTAGVVAGDTASIAFSVTCTLIPPTTGPLTVTTSTTGADLDPDGYTVTVDGSASQSIPTNSTGGVTFADQPAGSHSVALSGVASNCTVSGANPRTVNVVAGSGGSTAFAVTCTAPPTGNLTVSTATNGPNQPSGYTVSVDAGASQSVGANSSVTFTSLSVGSHSVGLGPIPSNCSVSGVNPQTVSITANNTTPASFAINCVAPQNHAPVVNAGTDPQTVLIGALFTLSGASFSDQDHDGPWTVRIDWGDGTSPTTFQMTSEGAINGSHSYADALIASHTLTITVTDAHAATGTASKTVNVVAL